MRRLFTWFGLGAGALLFFGRFRRRKGQPAVADPAEELKQKLAESRADGPAETEPEPAAAEPATPLDERRRAVHDRARAAIDDMLGGENLPGEETE